MSLTREMEGESLVLKKEDQIILTLTEQQTDNTVTVILDGSLKSETVHDFQDELMALILYGIDIVLDFEKVTYLSSACAQVLLNVQMKADDLGKGSIRMCKMPSVIMDDLDSTGLSDLLWIED